MTKVVPAVRAEHLIAANNQHTEDYELWLEDPDLYPEPGFDAVSTALKGQASPDEMLTVLLRLYALHHFLDRHNDLTPWFSGDTDKEGKMPFDEALFKAAARAPLAHEGPTVGGIIFDKATFMPILLEETEIERNA